MPRKAKDVIWAPRTLRTPPQESKDESTYQCELCLVMNNQDKVQCDVCHLWYHFKCVNVTSDVEDRYWACLKCEKDPRKESTPTKTTEPNVTQPIVTSTTPTKTTQPDISNSIIASSTNVDAKSLGAAGQTSFEVPMIPSPIDLTTKDTSTVNKPPSSRKSASISSAVSRRKTLLLQRLEEERQLLEKRDSEFREQSQKRDQEYLDKKYSLLEIDSDNDISLADEELEMFKRDRTKQWSIGAAKQDDAADKVSSDINPPSNAISTVVTKSNVIQTNRQLNRSESFQPPGQRNTVRVRRLSQGSNKSGRKGKEVENGLPSWLSAPSKAITKMFQWPAKTDKTTISSTANPVSWNQLALEPPKNSNFFFKPDEKKLDLTTKGVSNSLPTNCSSTIVTSSTVPKALNSVNVSSKVVQVTSNAIPTSIASQQFYFGLRPTPTSTVELSSIRPSNSVSDQANHFVSHLTSTYLLGVNDSSTLKNISSQQSKVSQGISNAIPASTVNNQEFYLGLRPESTSAMGLPIQSSTSANDQAIKIGVHPTSTRTFRDNAWPSYANMFTSVPSYGSTVSQQQLQTFDHAVSSSNFGGSSIYSNKTPVMTTSQAFSFGYSSNNTSSIPPRSLNTVYNSNSLGNGTTTQNYPHAPNHNVNRNHASVDMNSLATVPAGVNDSVSSINRVRLTAEQIAARHVIPKLPHFYGDPRKWQAFISAYEYATDACGFTNVENLRRLQDSIKGDAETAVGARLLHPNCVPGVMNTLKLLYGRPELIIESMIEDIRKIQPPKDDDLGSLIRFAIAVQNLCGSIQETGSLEHLRNPTLMNTITDKLPTQVQLNWAYHRHSVGVVDLASLGDWLYNLADIASHVVRTPTTTGQKKDKEKKASEKKDGGKQVNYLNAQIENKSNTHSESKQESNASNTKCLACKSDTCSKIATCKKFKDLSRTEKWSFVKENKLCARCLGRHSFYRCRSNQSCKADGCTKKHHTVLHDYGNSNDGSKNQTTESKSTDSKKKSSTSVCNSQRSTDNRTDIFRIVPIVLYNDGNVVRDFAYLDDGSNLTLMENELADQLGLVGTPQSVCIDWAFGQTHKSEESRIVATRISGFFHQAPSYKLENVRTVKDLHLPTQSLTPAWLEGYDYLKNIPIVTYNAVKPRMLIGLQYSKLMVSMETIEGAWNEPIACRTRLGWVVRGPSYNNTSLEQKKFSLNLCQCQSSDDKLHQLVKQYFAIENFGVKINDKFLESKEIQRARQILESTTVKKNSRYESGPLWKYDHVDLPDSYNMAFKRLQCLESKMTKNPQLSEKLCDQIKQFVQKGYVRKLSSIELEQKNDREWYLPIFPVFNAKKPEKIRIVWDAAAKVKNISLNSMLLTGPDLLVPLVDILRRFRERLIALLADIKEMYHQIQMAKRDQHVQRFLWRDGDSTRKPEVYIMLVSTFGAACSPCTAQFVKNKNANEYKEKYPEAVAAITQNTYVDDLLECVHETEEAIKLAKAVKFVNQQGGFETRNFLSNSKRLLEEIGERNVAQSKNLNISTDFTLGTERVLGMFWDTETDEFTYSLKYTKVNQNILSGSHCPTKREVLKVLMSIFDPLGLLANFLVHGKILLQEIWRSNVQWDDKITTDIQTKWMKWITALKDVENIRIPRLYSPKLSPKKPDSIQLHVFVDASVEAFAAAAYLRIEDVKGVDCCLVGAKTKVAPNKPMSVPRLELQAGVLGTRLSTSIQASQRLDIERVVYWSDSKTVMGWINSEARRYHQFVAFRIGEILESSDPAEWRWVPSEHNVADEATKSKSIPKFDSSSRWFKGPGFLYGHESSWFVEENQHEHHTQEEVRPGFVMACRQGKTVPIVDIKRFSQWNRLVHTTAYVFRFIYNLKSMEKRSGPLSKEEIIRSENQLYRIAQENHYLDEVAILKQNAGLPPEEHKYMDKSSDLYKCSPYLDEHEVLRIKGRLDAAKCLPEETKRPIIMPRRHYITKLIVNHYHRRYLHLNHQTVLNEIKQKYDIPALRVVLKEVRNSCQKCKNDSAVPRIPEMAELPFARLAAYERPFTYVGVDYFGPFKVKITRNCGAARWGVLFTCLTTRAIHLEVAHSLNTSSCIMAFERFTTVCGQPRQVHSDNGSNFHGMENELKEEFKKLNQDEIQRTFTNSEMSWSFNPPLSPHMGGAWERLIRTVKSCFKKIVSTRNPTDESLPTLFANVENIVNSRPLTYISLDSADDEALTPNHFLLGSSNGRKPFIRSSPKDLGKNDWVNIQEQTNQFWKRFVLEYMPTLTKRTKWFQQSKQVKAGDVVIIVDENNPRNTWPKGVVERTIVGKGGKRRQAIVRVVFESKNGPVHKEYRRSVHKLAVLDVKVAANEGVNQHPVESINGGETVGQH